MFSVNYQEALRLRRLEMEIGQRTEEELLQKHRRQRNALQGKIQSLKKSSTKGDKKKKKEIMEQIAQLELELEKKQNEELLQLKHDTGVYDEPADDSGTHLPAPRVSKAQRRRDKKVIREKERECMILAEEAENIRGPRNVEIQKIKQILKERNLMIKEIPSDGNCLYCAIDDQLKLHGDDGLGTESLRKMTGQYLKEHKSDFFPFISHPDTGDQLTDEQYEDYCDEVIYTSAWGGELEFYNTFSIPNRASYTMKYCYNKLQKTPEIISKFYYSASESSIRFYNNIMYALRKLT
ncbi:OTU domain-containing protein 6B isoform X2 [Zootermopsis nevadensis]|uniref:OTU domain-containing protein 6B isoform X2 n=1 Tax=Zootermopsis nevadensis TaxID=136037 RepID=UPI000B8E57F5|nr:OTU domain-containing protein 6B isoform X2 [Zootermopsis nevadensis]